MDSSSVKARVISAMRAGHIFAGMGIEVGYSKARGYGKAGFWTGSCGFRSMTDEAGAWAALRMNGATDKVLEAMLTRLGA